MTMSRRREPSMVEPTSYGWHLDRRVPLALLLGLFLQFAAGVYWASGMSHDLTTVKSTMKEVTEDLKVKSTAISEIIALKAEQRHILSTLERLERAIERWGQPMPPRSTHVVPRPKAATP